MTDTSNEQVNGAWIAGVKDAIPLLGGYIPVAISFGLIAVQSGFSVLAAVLTSTLIYAGASQFLFVAMVASDAPLWLVIVMTLLINARHVVYAPNLAPYLSRQSWWLWLMHGLTDQIFALAHARLPQLPEQQRMGWYSGAACLAWFSWIAGTAVGAVTGGQLIERWPLLADVLPFALPALFLVLLAPRFSSRIWLVTTVTTTTLALVFKLGGLPNAAIPLAAMCGAILYYAVKDKPLFRENAHG